MLMNTATPHGMLFRSAIFAFEKAFAFSGCSTFEAMLDVSGIEEAEELSGEKWNGFVAAHSPFSRWEEMYAKANEE